MAKETGETHWIEWLTGGISALLVAALLGWLAYDALRYTPAAPAFAVSVLAVTPETEGFRVAFEVRNTALSAAASVVVRGELADGESADVTFDYVAAQSRETGAFFFHDDPRGGGLRLAVAGYAKP